MFSSSGGVLFAERILRDLARHLTARGVALHIHEQVVRVDSARAAIVTADGREDRGDALIVAEGFWAPQLLPALAGRVTPSRQVPVYLAPPQDRLAAWRAAPMVLIRSRRRKAASKPCRRSTALRSRSASGSRPRWRASAARRDLSAWAAGHL